jgi:DNA-binding transcriptional LysR family regulator
MLLGMDLKQLRYFVAVAEAGHITRAARILGMQQPPLSQQMKALEARVGVQLLLRHPRGVSVTEAGQLLLADARRILADVASVELRVAHAASGLTGRLAISFTSSAAAHRFTPDALRECRKTYPGIELVLGEDNAAGIIEAIAASRLDCGLLREPTSHPQSLAFEMLLREPVVVALPTGHRLLPMKPSAARRTVISLLQLQEDGFILVRRPGGQGLYSNLLTLCRNLGFEPKIVAEVPRMMTNLNLVAAGAGVTVVPASMAQTHRHAIVYCDLKESPQLDAPLTLVYRKGELQGALEKFVKLVRVIACKPVST